MLDVVALVDLALPQGSSTSSEHYVEAIAMSCMVLQAVQQCRSHLAYNCTCSTKLDASAKLLRPMSRTKCLVGDFERVMNTTDLLKDAQRRLDKWRTPKESEDKGAGKSSLGNLLVQLDTHLGSLWMDRPGVNKWVICLGSLNEWSESQHARPDIYKPRHLKDPHSASHASLLWVECDPSKYAALLAARSMLDQGGAGPHRSSLGPGSRLKDCHSDYLRSSMEDKYKEYVGFMRSCFQASGPAGGGDPLTFEARPNLPLVRRMVLVTLEELVDRGRTVGEKLQHFFATKLKDDQVQTATSSLVDFWPSPSDPLSKLCSNLRCHDKRFWEAEENQQNQIPAPAAPAPTGVAPVVPAALQGGTRAPLAPQLQQLQGQGQRVAVKPGIAGAPLPAAVKGSGAKPGRQPGSHPQPPPIQGPSPGAGAKVGTAAAAAGAGVGTRPAAGPGGFGAQARARLPGVRPNKLKEQLAATAAVAATQPSAAEAVPAAGAAAVGAAGVRGQARPPAGPAQAKPDPQADALAALQAAEKVQEELMSQLQAGLEALPSSEQATWFPDWPLLHSVAQAACGPAVDTLLTCSVRSVKLALHATGKQRTAARKRSRQVKAQRKASRTPARGPAPGAAGAEVGAAAAAPDVVEHTRRKKLKRPSSAAAVADAGRGAGGPGAAAAAAGGAAAEVAELVDDSEEGEESNSEPLPVIAGELTTRASKSRIWTLLDKRWFKYSSANVYALSIARPACNPTCTSKMRLARLAYCACLYIQAVQLLDCQLDNPSKLKRYTRQLRGCLEEMEFLTAPLGGHRRVYEEHYRSRLEALPKLLDHMAKEFKGEFNSEDEIDVRISGNTAQGNSEASDTFSDANCAGGGRARGGPADSGGGGSMSRAMGRSRAQPEGSAGSRPPTSSSGLRCGPRLEEVDSGHRGTRGALIGKVAPMAQAKSYLRSRMPGLDKWRPAVAVAPSGKPGPSTAPPAAGAAGTAGAAIEAQNPSAKASSKLGQVAVQAPSGPRGTAAGTGAVAAMAPGPAAAAPKAQAAGAAAGAAPDTGLVLESPPDRPATAAARRLNMDLVPGSPEFLGATPVDQLKAKGRRLDVDAGLGLLTELGMDLEQAGQALGQGGTQGAAAAVDYGSSWLMPAGRRLPKHLLQQSQQQHSQAPHLMLPPASQQQQVQQAAGGSQAWVQGQAVQGPAALGAEQHGPQPFAALGYVPSVVPLGVTPWVTTNAPERAQEGEGDIAMAEEQAGSEIEGAEEEQEEGGLGLGQGKVEEGAEEQEGPDGLGGGFKRGDFGRRRKGAAMADDSCLAAAAAVDSDEEVQDGGAGAVAGGGQQLGREADDEEGTDGEQGLPLRRYVEPECSVKGDGGKAQPQEGVQEDLSTAATAQARGAATNTAVTGGQVAASRHAVPSASGSVLSGDSKGGRGTAGVQGHKAGGAKAGAAGGRQPLPSRIPQPGANAVGATAAAAGTKSGVAAVAGATGAKGLLVKPSASSAPSVTAGSKALGLTGASARPGSAVKALNAKPAAAAAVDAQVGSAAAAGGPGAKRRLGAAAGTTLPTAAKAQGTKPAAAVTHGSRQLVPTDPAGPAPQPAPLPGLPLSPGSLPSTALLLIGEGEQLASKFSAGRRAEPLGDRATPKAKSKRKSLAQELEQAIGQPSDFVGPTATECAVPGRADATDPAAAADPSGAADAAAPTGAAGAGDAAVGAQAAAASQVAVGLRQALGAAGLCSKGANMHEEGDEVVQGSDKEEDADQRGQAVAAATAADAAAAEAAPAAPASPTPATVFQAAAGPSALGPGEQQLGAGGAESEEPHSQQHTLSDWTDSAPSETPYVSKRRRRPKGRKGMPFAAGMEAEAAVLPLGLAAPAMGVSLEHRQPQPRMLSPMAQRPVMLPQGLWTGQPQGQGCASPAGAAEAPLQQHLPPRSPLAQQASTAAGFVSQLDNAAAAGVHHVLPLALPPQQDTPQHDALQHGHNGSLPQLQGAPAVLQHQCGNAAVSVSAAAAPPRATAASKPRATQREALTEGNAGADGESLVLHPGAAAVAPLVCQVVPRTHVPPRSSFGFAAELMKGLFDPAQETYASSLAGRAAAPMPSPGPTPAAPAAHTPGAAPAAHATPAPAPVAPAPSPVVVPSAATCVSKPALGSVSSQGTGTGANEELQRPEAEAGEQAVEGAEGKAEEEEHGTDPGAGAAGAAAPAAEPAAVSLATAPVPRSARPSKKQRQGVLPDDGDANTQPMTQAGAEQQQGAGAAVATAAVVPMTAPRSSTRPRKTPARMAEGDWLFAPMSSRKTGAGRRQEASPAPRALETVHSPAEEARADEEEEEGAAEGAKRGVLRARALFASPDAAGTRRGGEQQPDEQGLREGQVQGEEGCEQQAAATEGAAQATQEEVGANGEAGGNEEAGVKGKKRKASGQRDRSAAASKRGKSKRQEAGAAPHSTPCQVPGNEEPERGGADGAAAAAAGPEPIVDGQRADGQCQGAEEEAAAAAEPRTTKRTRGKGGKGAKRQQAVLSTPGVAAALLSPPHTLTRSHTRSGGVAKVTKKTKKTKRPKGGKPSARKQVNGTKKDGEEGFLSPVPDSGAGGRRGPRKLLTPGSGAPLSQVAKHVRNRRKLAGVLDQEAMAAAAGTAAAAEAGQTEGLEVQEDTVAQEEGKGLSAAPSAGRMQGAACVEGQEQVPGQQAAAAAKPAEAEAARQQRQAGQQEVEGGQVEQAAEHGPQQGAAPIEVEVQAEGVDEACEEVVMDSQEGGAGEQPLGTGHVREAIDAPVIGHEVLGGLETQTEEGCVGRAGPQQHTLAGQVCGEGRLQGGSPGQGPDQAPEQGGSLDQAQGRGEGHGQQLEALEGGGPGGQQEDVLASPPVTRRRARGSPDSQGGGGSTRTTRSRARAQLQPTPKSEDVGGTEGKRGQRRRRGSPGVPPIPEGLHEGGQGEEGEAGKGTPSPAAGGRGRGKRPGVVAEGAEPTTARKRTRRNGAAEEEAGDQGQQGEKDAKKGDPGSSRRRQR